MASGQPPDHYATLGLQQTATMSEVKKRYRELAQRYHPDVSHDPDAGAKIARINEAYRVLGDPERRATYDAERFLAKKASVRASQTRQRSTGAGPRVDPRGDGRPSSNAQSGAGGSAPGPAGAPRYRNTASERRSSERSADVARLLAEARLAYANRQYNRVEAICLGIQRLDSRSAEAYEILGEARLKLKNVDGAITAWTYAIQFNPRNYVLQGRLDRLTTGRAHHREPHPTVSQHARSSAATAAAVARRESALAVVNVLGMLMLVTILTVLVTRASSTSSSVDVLVEFFGMAAVGGLAGLLLALNARMRPAAEELASTASHHSRPPLSLGPLLAGFAVVCFYVSLLAFVVITIKRNKLSVSILYLYLAVLVLIGALSLLSREEGWTMLIALWSGNIMFPCALFGWSIGDTLRLRR